MESKFFTSRRQWRLRKESFPSGLKLLQVRGWGEGNKELKRHTVLRLKIEGGRQAAGVGRLWGGQRAASEWRGAGGREQQAEELGAVM